MLYKNSDLPKGSLEKPYIYTNFVSTVDGKVQVVTDWKSYWPIGSETDHKVLTELRAFSDVLIHGSGIAKLSPFVTKVQNPYLKKIRTSLGKNEILPYAVLSNNPDKKLISHLKNYAGGKALLFTSKKSIVPEDYDLHVNLVRVGQDKIDIKEVVNYLTTKLKAKRILMEGGPTLFGSFLEKELIDEIFLTVAPKIFGNETEKTLSLVENRLLPKEKVINLNLASVKQIGDELYLRYKLVK